MLTLVKTNGYSLKIFISIKLSKLRALGFIWFFKEVSYRLLQELGWLLLSPCAFFAHLLGLRRVPFLYQHIGHLAIELDTFIKARHLGLVPEAHYFILAPLGKVANPHLLSYWRPHLKVITQPQLCFLLGMLTRRYFACYRGNLHRVAFFGTQEVYRINKLWGQRPPLLTLNKLDEAESSQAFVKLGIPENQWFVCLHVREKGFLPNNEAIQAHRNASINNAIPAIHDIIRRGGMVVRMGDPTMSPLMPPIAGVIDYARHSLKSDRMDVLLCAKARFFLGCTSGLFFLSVIFGVPVALVNMIPVETLGIRPGDLSIPKRVWSEVLGRYLSYTELLTSKMGGYFFTHQYQVAGIRADENDGKDILGLMREMLDRLDGQYRETEADKLLHERYLSLFKPGHYSYGAVSRVGLEFLQRYQDLI